MPQGSASAPAEGRAASVLFATNRQQGPNDMAGLPTFTDVPLPATPEGLLCAAATVAGIDVTRPQHGNIAAITPISQAGFDAADLRTLLDSPRDILVFVHGAANDFTDAITRAAYNKVWLAQAKLADVASDFDVIAFCWPARHYFIPDILGDLIDYHLDQQAARQSAYHFGLLMTLLYELQPRLGRRRLNLLCHSMGNDLLGGAVELWFANPGMPPLPLFDEVVLAAADETATTFSAPDGRRLSNLWRLGREITVYYNNDDKLLQLSNIVNRDFRLGYDGPPNKADTRFFSPNVYEFVDCTGVNDYISNDIDRSHQYYRQSPTVRADIADSLAGAVPRRPRYDPETNVYSLFPPVG